LHPWSLRAVIKELRFAVALVFSRASSLGGGRLAHLDSCFAHHPFSSLCSTVWTNTNAMVGVAGCRWDFVDEVQGLGTWRARVLFGIAAVSQGKTRQGRRDTLTHSNSSSALPHASTLDQPGRSLLRLCEWNKLMLRKRQWTDVAFSVGVYNLDTMDALCRRDDIARR
jgi:hypothetical protein